jgi:hypothetical protein
MNVAVRIDLKEPPGGLLSIECDSARIPRHLKQCRHNRIFADVLGALLQKRSANAIFAQIRNLIEFLLRVTCARCTSLPRLLTRSSKNIIQSHKQTSSSRVSNWTRRIGLR